MSDTKSELLSPILIGGMPIPNRVVMAPMTRARAGNDGVPSELAADYYSQRATAGLIITESTYISQQGRGAAFTPGIVSREQVVAWKRVVDAVHEKGGRIFLQLWHAGRISHSSLQKNGEAPVAPSAIRAGSTVYIEEGLVAPSEPRALDINEIRDIIDDFRFAASNAKWAGFDGVEIHAANSYLLDQFIRDSTNHRSDRYGGSISNRIRLTVEVARAVADTIGSRRVGVRISPITTAMGATPFDSDPQATYGALAARLGGMGLGYLHCVEGETRGSNAADRFDFLQIKRAFGGTYIANNGYDRAGAEMAIAEGRADLVAFGRPFIANPDTVECFRDNRPLRDAPREIYYGGGARGYTDWPRQVPVTQDGVVTPA